MSAWARALAWRSCSAITLSRCSWRFCASRISGAAYDACRTEHQRQEDEGVRRRSAGRGGARVFQAIQTMTKTVMQTRNRRGAHEAGERAPRSGRTRRGRTPGRRTRRRRASRGVSRRTRRASLIAAPADRRDGRAPVSAGPRRPVAPALGQHVVEHVVDRDGAEQAALVVDDGRGDQVVGRQVRGHLVQEASGRSGSIESSRAAGDQGGGRLAQQALEVGGAEEPARWASRAAGGRRRPARPAPG